MPHPKITELHQLLKIGIPAIGAQLATILMNFVDTVMSGNLSPEALAAVAVGSNLIMPAMVFGLGVLFAVNPVVAHALGAESYKEIGREVRQSLYLALFLSLPVMLVLFNVEPIIKGIGIEPEIVPVAVGYVAAFAWGMPAIFFFVALRAFNDGVGRTKPGFFIGVFGLGVNIIANYSLIYGNFGAPKLGAIGAGWASTIVNWIMFLVILAYTYAKRDYASFEIFNTIRLPQWAYLRTFLSIGVPNGFSFLIEVSMFAFVALMAGSMGTTAVAAHQIAINVASISFMVPFGLSTAITQRVGQFMGKKQPGLSAQAGWTGILFSGTIMCFSASLMFSVPQHIAGIYTQSQPVIDLAVELLYLAAIFQLSDGFQVSALGALRGLKDTTLPMIVNFFAYWILGLGLAWYFGFILELGARGLWMGLISGLTLGALLHNRRYYVLSKRHR